MAYEIILYEDASGRSQVREWLAHLKNHNPEGWAKAVTLIEDLEVGGPNLSSGKVKQIRGKIWELRAKSSYGTFRIYYWRQSRTQFVLATGECKQSPKANKKLVRDAEDAWKEFREEE